MGIAAWLSGLFGARAPNSIGSVHDGMMDPGPINPATGQPMMGGVDMMGNPWGVDLSPSHHWHDGHASSMSHDINGVGMGVHDHHHQGW